MWNVTCHVNLSFLRKWLKKCLVYKWAVTLLVNAWAWGETKTFRKGHIWYIVWILYQHVAGSSSRIINAVFPPFLSCCSSKIQCLSLWLCLLSCARLRKCCQYFCMSISKMQFRMSVYWICQRKFAKPIGF